MVEPVSVSQSYESISRRPNRSSRTTLRINPGACTKSRLSRKPEMTEKSSSFESVKGLLIGVLITAGAIYLLIAIGGTPRAPARAPESSFLVPVGSEGRLSRGSRKTLLKSGTDHGTNPARVLSLSRFSDFAGRWQRDVGVVARSSWPPVDQAGIHHAHRHSGRRTRARSSPSVAGGNLHPLRG